MHRIRLINPNTSRATTDMMVAIAGAALGSGWHVDGVTATTGVSMIVDADELAAAAPGVIAMGQAPGAIDGIIVSAFGDPGLAELRAAVPVPVAGIFEASVLEASSGGRRFGIATVTPGLAGVLAGKAAGLGLASRFTGTRLTPGDPRTLAADPALLEDELARAVEACLTLDRAEAVIIGGGPLGQAAIGLQRRFDATIIAPIPAATRWLLGRMG